MKAVFGMIVRPFWVCPHFYFRFFFFSWPGTFSWRYLSPFFCPQTISAFLFNIFFLCPLRSSHPTLSSPLMNPSFPRWHVFEYDWAPSPKALDASLPMSLPPLGKRDHVPPLPLFTFSLFSFGLFSFFWVSAF